MSTTPSQLDGSQAPSQIEFLWERYRRHFNTVVAVVLALFAAYYGWKWMHQRELDAHWSQFAASIGTEKSYGDTFMDEKGLGERLQVIELAELEKAAANADPGQAPYFLMAIARKAFQERNWDRAEKALADLESRFPGHSLVKANEYPVQVRENVKQEAPKDGAPAKKPELKPAKAGSAVSLMRERIAAAKGFQLPASYAKPEIPADAKKVKFEFGETGSITIALLASKAPKHCEEFLKLATKEGGAFWVGLSVDEIQRNGTGFARNPKQMHLGFETTKDPERSKWTKTDPSKNPLEFESNDLSHFEGAVAARPEADGKSCAERFWICAEDAAENDGQRVVFGYVVDGLDTVKKICESAMSTQEEEAGTGVPADKVTVTAVTVLQ